jgi:hypothetical protein
LIKCHIYQVVKKVILVKWTSQKKHVTLIMLGGFSQVDQNFNQNGDGSQVGPFEKP